MYDPRALMNLLEEQGLRNTGISQEDGDLVYWLTEPGGKRYGLTGSDLESLYAQGKLNQAGILARDEKLKEDQEDCLSSPRQRISFLLSVSNGCLVDAGDQTSSIVTRLRLSVARDAQGT